MHVVLISEKLRQSGHEVLPVCFKNGFLEGHLKKLNFHPIGLKLNTYVAPGGIKSLHQIIKQRNIDVIHCHYSKDLWTIVPAKQGLKNVKVVLSKHVGTARSKKDPFHKWLYGHVDHITAVSRMIYHNILQTHPISKDKVSVIYPGIDLERFNPNLYDAKKVKHELGWHPETRVIGIVSRIQIGKGFLEFLQMARQISERLPDVRFLIVGGATFGEEEEARYILNRIRDLNLQEKIYCTGTTDQVSKYLSCMDIFVFPSRAESFGMALVEAMAMQKPVIACNKDGIQDIIEPHKNGILVPPRDVNSLVQAVQNLLQDEKTRKHLAIQARRTIEKKFDIYSTILKLEDLFWSLISGTKQSIKYIKN